MLILQCLKFNAVLNGQRIPIQKHRVMHGEKVDGLYSYHAPDSYTPEAAAIVRDEILEILRVKWDLRWYFMAPDESPNLDHVNPSGSILGLACLNNLEMVSSLCGNCFGLGMRLIASDSSRTAGLESGAWACSWDTKGSSSC